MIKVAVALILAPLTGAVVLATIVAVPPPVAVASPVVLTVAMRVSLELQVTVFVRSTDVGVFEKFPIARNCACSPVFCTVWLVGMIVIDKRSRAAAVVPVTVNVPVAVTIPPFAAVAEAVIVVLPAETAVASPEELIVPTCTLLDFHVAVEVKSRVSGVKL